MAFDEFFDGLITKSSPALQDAGLKNSIGTLATSSAGDDRGHDLLGPPFADANSIFRACKGARKQLVDFCYQVSETY